MALSLDCESDMDLTWIWYTESWQARSFRESAIKVRWIWHEYGLSLRLKKIPWKWHESDMNMIYWIMIFWKFWGQVPWKRLENGMKVFGAMFFGVPSKCHEKWHESDVNMTWGKCHDVPWICREIAMKVPDYVCTFLWCFFSARCCVKHFPLMLFRFFIWSKQRVIRNTQTTNPNRQLSVTWLYIFVCLKKHRKLASKEGLDAKKALVGNNPTIFSIDLTKPQLFRLIRLDSTFPKL